MNTNNRLQFRHHNDVFTGSTLEEARLKAITYVESDMWYNEAYQENDYGHSLFSEPTVVRYSLEGEEENPHIIFVIGAATNDTNRPENNKFCIIDIDKTEQEIEDLWEEIEKVVESLTIVALSSNTLNLYANKTDEGTYVSGDVKVASAQVISGISRDNKIKVIDNEGLYLYVNLEYTNDGKLIFRVNDEVSEFSIPSLVSGEYIYTGDDAENIILTQNDGSKIKIDVGHLIDEWTVLPEDATTTPIVLTRAEVSGEPCPHGVEVWQDVLTADVRIKDDDDNILEKTDDGRKLYVGGKAQNIAYYKSNGDRSTVKEQLDRIKLNADGENILIEDNNGFFASVKLDYISDENKLVFVKSTVNGGVVTKDIELNSVEFLEDITYDPVTEEIVIRYVDNKGEHKQLRIPAKFVIEEWDVNNENHDINLVKTRVEASGKDILTADAKIHSGDNNILQDLNHELYVNGISNNIKYDVTGETTVKNVLDNLSSATDSVDSKIDQEIADRIADVDAEEARAISAEAILDEKINEEITNRITDVNSEETRAISAETILENKIGTGFTDDAHENVTYKFEQLTDKVNSEAEKLQNEIDRSTAKDTEHDGKIQAIEDEIGDGFGPRNTVRDEISNLQSEIDAVSADSSSRLSNVINEDESIDVDTRNDAAGNPTIKVVKVNLSTEVEDNRKNIIKLNSDGLFANVDLSYVQEANKLIFHTSNGEPDKEIQLDSVSSIIDIRYDAEKEAIVITYMTNGHEIKTLEIPVSGLIREWKPSESTNGAIKLTLTESPTGTTDKDILYAEVLISDHDDNIIMNDNGTLYVSNRDITANTSAIEALANRVSSAETDIDSLEAGLRDETTRAISAETALSNRINTISNDLEREVSRATNKENEIIGDLNDEIVRATTREDEIANNLSAEIERSTREDSALTTNLQNEIVRASSAETALGNRIDSVVTNLNNEISRSTSADTKLTNDLADEIARSTNKDEELTNAINGETTRATSAETALRTSINDETTRAQTREDNLQHSIDDEEEARISGDTILDGKISDEKARAEREEGRLQTLINEEVSRAQSAETSLRTAITEETLRAQNADNELYQKIADETADRVSGDSALDSKIMQEISRAQINEGVISGKVDSEITRSTNKDIELANAISGETEARREKDLELQQMIADATLTFAETNSIRFAKTTENVVSADVKLQGADNIIRVGQGLYASAHLSYDVATNKIKLTTTSESGYTEEEFQLAGATVIDNLYYDEPTGDIVITYHDGSGNVQTVRFPASQLFNEWVVENQAQGSAIELTKTPQSEEGQPDKLSARVILNEHEDNALVIDGNGLYVSSSAMTQAKEIAECAKAELKVVENNLLGMPILTECGEGAEYTKNLSANYISGATSFNHADLLLDKELKSANDEIAVINQEIDSLSGDSVCVDNKTNSIYKILYGSNAVMNECGEGNAYQPLASACIISAATSFNDADILLDNALCEIKDKWFLLGFDTPTTHTDWKEIAQNRHMLVDVRLSHGNQMSMDDEDFTISGKVSAFTESIIPREASDTNVLRIIDIKETNDGLILGPDNPYNGLYLSNLWDCGLYYDEVEDAEAIAQANEAGFVTDPYRTDTGSTASNYDYSNNVRQ